MRVEIGDLEEQVKTALGYGAVPEEVIEWRVQFAEVFDRGGFDVVLANPPYIQLQKDGGKLGLLYKDVGYTTFMRTGDIYELFYERGCQLLKANRGLLAYITSNSWLKAEYGKPLRRYLSEKQEPLGLLELGKDVFASAIVDTSVLLLREGSSNGSFPAVDVDHLSNADFPPERSLWGRVRPDGEASWRIMLPVEQSVMDKMQAEGTQLTEWNVKINRGVVTGYNKAFIIDDSTKRALVKKDPNSSDIIKPVLRGRDIERYRAKWAGRWLIATLPSLGLSIDNYPAIKKYLLSFGRQRLEQTGATLPNGKKARKNTQHNWFELQDSIAYYEEFSKEKLFWIDLTEKGRFAYDDGQTFSVNTVYMISGSSIKYLCAMLNSSLITWYIKNAALTSGMGTTRWFAVSVEAIPIPKISAADQRPFVRLVDSILEAKAANPDADTSHLEWEIDRLVYDLYGLTEEEETAIERSLGLIHATDEEEDAALAKWIREGMTGTYVSRKVVMEALRNRDGD